MAAGRIDAESFVNDVLPLEDWATGLDLVGKGAKWCFRSPAPAFGSQPSGSCL